MILGNRVPFHEKYNLFKENDSSVLTLNTVGGYLWNTNICKPFM